MSPVQMVIPTRYRLGSTTGDKRRQTEQRRQTALDMLNFPNQRWGKKKLLWNEIMVWRDWEGQLIILPETTIAIRIHIFNIFS
jgi:hypothetical protein